MRKKRSKFSTINLITAINRQNQLHLGVSVNLHNLLESSQKVTQTTTLVTNNQRDYGKRNRIKNLVKMHAISP